MALYHFSVKQVSRGKGQTVVNSAAYISGQKLYNDYYGQTHDYTKKSGVVFTEILTPEYVPERLTDRETFWNEVEKVEKSKRAQLAYFFDIALQNELTLDENIELARAFCREQFVARGMIVDLAVHEGNPRMRMNQTIHIFMCLLQFVLLQKMGAGGTSRNGNMFWMKTEIGLKMPKERIYSMLFPLPDGMIRSF